MRQVGDDVGHIALDHAPALGLDELRIEIDPLPRQNGPLVEPGGVAAQVPLADHARVIARRLEVLRHRGLRAVEAVEGRHAVEVAVLAGEDRRPAGAADRVDAEAVVEPHARLGQAIEVGRLVHPAAIGADGVRGVVVAHDEQDVGPARRPRCRGDSPGKPRRSRQSATDSSCLPFCAKPPWRQCLNPDLQSEPFPTLHQTVLRAGWEPETGMNSLQTTVSARRLGVNGGEEGPRRVTATPRPPSGHLVANR